MKDKPKAEAVPQTSRAEYESVREQVAKASSEQLVAAFHHHNGAWEVPGVDRWAARYLPKIEKIKDDARTVSDIGLERLGEHLRSRLAVVEAELSERKKRKGAPRKPDTWLLALFYFELMRRGRKHEASRGLRRNGVSAKTLKRALDIHEQAFAKQ